MPQKPAVPNQELLDEVMFSILLKILEGMDPQMFQEILNTHHADPRLVQILKQHNSDLHNRLRGRMSQPKVAPTDNKSQRKRADGKVDHMDGITAAARNIFLNGGR